MASFHSKHVARALGLMLWHHSTKFNVLANTHTHTRELPLTHTHTHTQNCIRQENNGPSPTPNSPTVKYLNSADLYTETGNGRRDSKTSNSSSTKNDYYYDKENELYSQRRIVSKPKLAPPREEREQLNNSSSSSSYQRHQQQQQLTSSLSPIPSPTLNVTKFCFVLLTKEIPETGYVFEN